MITIYTDFKSPAAYLALKPTLALLKEFGVDCKWLPYTYNAKQEIVPPQNPNETKTETHFRIRAKLRRETHLRYAGVQNTPMTFPNVPGSTDIALAALLAVERNPIPFVEAAFKSYWVDQADLNDAQTVLELMNAHGHAVSAEDLGEALEKLPAHQLAAEEAGIVDAPAYVIDDQIFIGREHLPWIRSILKEK